MVVILCYYVYCENLLYQVLAILCYYVYCENLLYQVLIVVFDYSDLRSSGERSEPIYDFYYNYYCVVIDYAAYRFMSRIFVIEWFYCDTIQSSHVVFNYDFWRRSGAPETKGGMREDEVRTHQTRCGRDR